MEVNESSKTSGMSLGRAGGGGRIPHRKASPGPQGWATPALPPALGLGSCTFTSGMAARAEMMGSTKPMGTQEVEVHLLSAREEPGCPGSTG